MGTSIFYSGVESDTFYDIGQQYANCFLMSFYYLSKKGDFLRERMQDNPDRRFMVDSGAHTFFKEGEHQNWGIVEWEAYLKRYTDWLRANRMYVYAAVELDIGKLVGQPIIETWRERYFKPLEDIGMQIVYMWHYDLGFAEFENMCRKYRYVGLTNDTYKRGDTHRMMQTARRYKTKVHGFAITGYKAIRDYGMATADSTTWLKKGSQYGEWYLWTGDKLRLIAHKEDRPKWRSHIEQIGMDYEAACNEDYRVNASINIHEFRRMEDHYAKRNKGDYWKVRLPYPKVITVMTVKQLEAWMYHHDLVAVVNKHGLRESLGALSCLQNSDLAEYLVRQTENDAALTDALNVLVVVQDMVSLERYRDVWNSAFIVVEKPLARTTEDYADKNVMMERDGDSQMESLVDYETEEKHEKEIEREETGEQDTEGQIKQLGEGDAVLGTEPVGDGERGAVG